MASQPAATVNPPTIPVARNSAHFKAIVETYLMDLLSVDVVMHWNWLFAGEKTNKLVLELKYLKAVQSRGSKLLAVLGKLSD